MDGHLSLFILSFLKNGKKFANSRCLNDNITHISYIEINILNIIG